MSTAWIKIFSLVLLCKWAKADRIAECLNKENMYISSEESCSRYIFCYGDDSFEGDCDDDAPYFSEVDQTCDSDPAVCKSAISDGDIVEEPNVPPNMPEENPPSSSVQPSEVPSSSMASPTVPSVPLQNTTSPIITPSSTLAPTFSSTLSSSSSTVISTTETSVVETCPPQDDPSQIIFLLDSQSCSDYFMCYHGQPLAMHCAPHLHFDIKSSKCDYPENVKCRLDTASPREKCQSHTVDVYPHPLNCNYYYMCKYGYLMIMQCPPNMDWDYTINACVVRGKAKCSTALENRRN